MPQPSRCCSQGPLALDAANSGRASELPLGVDLNDLPSRRRMAGVCVFRTTGIDVSARIAPMGRCAFYSAVRLPRPGACPAAEGLWRSYAAAASFRGSRGSEMIGRGGFVEGKGPSDLPQRSPEDELVIRAIDCPRRCVNRTYISGRHGLPAAMIACQKSTARNTTTQIRRTTSRVSRPRVLSAREVSRSGSLMRNSFAARQRANLTRH